MSTDAPPLTDKQMAMETLSRMSELATLDEISERFALVAAPRRGQQAYDEGRVVTHEEFKRRLAQWTQVEARPGPI